MGNRELSLIFFALRWFGWSFRDWSASQRGRRDFIRHTPTARVWTRTRDKGLWSLHEGKEPGAYRDSGSRSVNERGR